MSTHCYSSNLSALKLRETIIVLDFPTAHTTAVLVDVLTVLRNSVATTHEKKKAITYRLSAAKFPGSRGNQKTRRYNDVSATGRCSESST